MSESTSIIVIGAGIVGVATALNLLRAGRPVTIVDKQAPGDGASFGNGGILVPSSIVPVTVPGLLKKAPRMLLDPSGPLYLRWRYLPRLLPWLTQYLGHCTAEHTERIAAGLAPMVAQSLDEHRRLAKGTAAERRIRAMSYAFVYRDKAHYDADGFGWRLRRENGIVWRTVEGDAVLEAEPALDPAYRFLAIFDDQHGTIDAPGDYVKDLARAFVAEGGHIERREINRLERGADGRIRLHTDQGILGAETVVVATGAWSARLLASLGIKIPLESERGYHIELVEPSLTLNNALMLSEGKCVATPMSGRIRIAGLVEFAGLDAGPSRAPIRTLLTWAKRMFPGLTFEHHTEWMGHRPAPADSLPIIGSMPGADGLFAAFGHHHVGMTSGPRTGRLLADLIVGRRPNVDLSIYRPSRFTGRG